MIIRQLLDFSRPSTGKPEKTHVHEIIRRTVEILKPQSLMEGIEAMGFDTPTPIQQQAIPPIMEGRDMIGSLSM